MQSEAEYSIVMTACPTLNDAEKIARTLVELQIAACVQIVPQILSFYRWQGVIESSQEYLLLIKTASHTISEIEKQITLYHPYEVPEIIMVPIQAISPSFAAWINSVVTDDAV